jgi:hypothetical protein
MRARVLGATPVFLPLAAVRVVLAVVALVVVAPVFVVPVVFVALLVAGRWW